MAKAIGIVIVAIIITSAIAGGIATALLESGQDIEENATAFTVVLIQNMIVWEFILLAAAVWFGMRKYGLPLAALGIRRPDHDPPWLPVALGLAGLALVYGYEAAAGLTGIDADVSTPDETFESAGPFIIVAVGAVLLAPVIEEMFFRGFIFQGLRQPQGWARAALLSGLLFAAAHLSLYVLPPFAAIGFLFAWSYQYTGSIKAPIIAHAIINLVTVSAGLISSGAI
jgi:membrane protease YdiL (CAAX protease family)